MVERRWYPLSPQQEAVATELVVLREELGISQARAARECGLSNQRLSEVEKADRPPNREELDALLTMYAAAPAVYRRLYGLADQKLEASDSWWLPKHKWVPDPLAYVMRAEKRATNVYTAQGQYVPALLQTPRYMAELLTGTGTPPSKVQRGADVRLGRQRHFFGGDRKVRLHVILAESLLDVGPKDVLQEQLEHLLKSIDRKLAEIRIVPNDQLYPLFSFTFMAFHFGHSVGYFDGGYESFDVARMREFKKLNELKDRYNSYTRVALSAEQSVDVIEQHIKKNR